jgi:hypothetical protein
MRAVTVTLTPQTGFNIKTIPIFEAVSLSNQKLERYKF